MLSVIRLNVDMLSVVVPSTQPIIEVDILALTTVGFIEIIIYSLREQTFTDRALQSLDHLKWV
jgi:hypothetical protein